MIFSLDTIYNFNCRWVLWRKLPRATLCIIVCGCMSLLPTLASAADKPGATRGLLSDFFASTTGEVEVYVDVHTKNADPGVRNEVASLWSELKLQNYINFFDSLRLETELVITASAPNLQSGLFTSAGVINPEPPFADFRIFMLTWQGNNTAVSLGKGVIELGYAEIYTPVDRFNSQNYGKPQHFKDRGDLQLSVSRFFSASELTFTLLPFNEDFIDPPGESRWLNSQGDRDFFNQIGAKDEDRPHSFPEDWGYLIRYSGVGRGFDYYLAAHYGQGAYPIIQFSGIVIPPKTRKVYPTATSGMAGIVGTSGSWSYYIDVIYQKTHSREDDSYVRYALGFSYRGTKWARRWGLVEITPVLTYSGQTVVEDSSPAVTLHDSEAARPHPDSLLARLDVRFTDKSRMNFLGSKNFTDDDGSFGLGLQYNHSDSLWFSALALFLHGKDNTQLGRWRTNDYVSVGFNYRF